MNSQKTVMDLLQEGFHCQNNGDPNRAWKLYREVLRQEPTNVHALNLLGMLAVNQGRSSEAVELITLALSQDEHDPQAHANIALAYKNLGQLDLAITHFQQAVQLSPQNPVIHNNLGNVLRDSDQPREAVRHFEAALKIDRQFAGCWSNLGAAHNDLDDYERGLYCVEQALKIDSDLAEAYNVKAGILRKLARFEESRKDYDKAIALAPRFTEAMISLSDVLRDLEQPEEAVATLNKALEIEPNNPFAYHALGVVHEQIGQADTAAEYFRQALIFAPGYASAYYQLAQLKNCRLSEDELARLLQLWQSQSLLPSDRKMIAFALFRVLDERDLIDEAYSYLAEGNRIKAEARPYDDAVTATMITRMHTSTEELLQRHTLAAASDQACAPIFVLGMPRSGTTLTEQILASHTQVSGAGEVSYAFDCVRMASKMTGKPFPECVAHLNASNLQELGALYMKRHYDSDLVGRYVVDKTPLNFQYIGLLSQALPTAKFIHCQRNPVDNCFSIHRIPFEEQQTYAHSLRSLGQYYCHYHRLMAKWRQMFPDRILDLSYEATVADIEAQARGMFDFLGLDFEPDVLTFYQSSRLVKTPSASQVRQPIYSDSVQAWKRYEAHLGELLETLKPVLT